MTDGSRPLCRTDFSRFVKTWCLNNAIKDSSLCSKNIKEGRSKIWVSVERERGEEGKIEVDDGWG